VGVNKKSADISQREKDISEDYHDHENPCHHSFILEQSGAEIESMIEHLEMRDYFAVPFWR